MKRVAVAVLLLALLGLAACGDDEPAQPVVEVPEWAKVAPEQIAEAKKLGVPVAFENDLGMRFVLIPAGTFLMGTPKDEIRWSWETPQHEVTISRPFYMAIYEVTNGQYRAFKPDHDSGDDADFFEEATAEDDLNGGRQPAVRIPDVDAMAFSRWLGMREGGRTYALPTEAEWHYACRAGSSTTFAWGDDPADAAKYANVFDGRRRDRLDERNTMASPILSAQVEDDGFAMTAPVGSYLPNAWGLFDMHGNASEWCRDWASKLTAEAVTDPQGPEAGEHRATAGGNYDDEMYFQRASSRTSQISGLESGAFRVGFRLVSPLPER